MDGGNDDWIDGRTNGWVSGLMDGWMDYDQSYFNSPVEFLVCCFLVEKNVFIISLESECLHPGVILLTQILY